MLNFPSLAHFGDNEYAEMVKYKAMALPAWNFALAEGKEC